jgi:hypothetical protein
LVTPEIAGTSLARALHFQGLEEFRASPTWLCSRAGRIAGTSIAEILMKMTWLVLCLACATAAFGQSVAGGSTGLAAVSSEPQPIQMMTHPQHAAEKPMASEQSLLGNSTYSYARGERPLWEVAPVVKVTPLGDSARDLKKEHLAAKKASKVFEN